MLVSGGSAANLTAIACARETLVGPMSPRIVAYASDQTHSSLARAARHLGFRPDQIRVLPDRRPLPDPARRPRGRDRRRRRGGPAAVPRIANAGHDEHGRIDDPLPELAALCRERGVWLHVDGAYGAFAVLTERGRAALAGLELADSVTLDPHKWLAMPFEVGCLMVRDGREPRAGVRAPPGVPPGAASATHAVNFADRGLQLTRASRAIKVWLAIQTFGVDAFRAVIDRAMDLTLDGPATDRGGPRGSSS